MKETSYQQDLQGAVEAEEHQGSQIQAFICFIQRFYGTGFVCNSPVGDSIDGECPAKKGPFRDMWMLCAGRTFG